MANAAESLSLPAKRRRRNEPGEQLTKVRVQEDRLFYDAILKYVATERQLDENGYPRPGNGPGCARFACQTGVLSSGDSNSKVCYRCGEQFSLKELGKEKCIYHRKRCSNNVWGCCVADPRAKGCMTSETHVHADNERDTSGYVRIGKKVHKINPGFYALDTEMSYTVNGRELTRISIVDRDGKTFYDTYVKPCSKILSYNTEYSGITEDKLRGVTTTLADVQNFLLEKFSKESVFIGHSLEYDCIALRLVHENVVDTSLVFPHPNGLPYKNSRYGLAKRWLGRNMNDNNRGNSVEDAAICMRLMMLKIQSPWIFELE